MRAYEEAASVSGRGAQKTRPTQIPTRRMGDVKSRVRCVREAPP